MHIRKIFIKILLGLFLLNSMLMADSSKELVFSLDEEKFLEVKLQNRLIDMSYNNKGETATYTFSSSERKELLSKGMESAMVYVEKRLNMFGIPNQPNSTLYKIANTISLNFKTKVSISKNSKNQIVLNFINIEKDFYPEMIVSLICNSKNMEFLAVDEKRDASHKSMSPMEVEKHGDIILSDIADNEETYLLKKNAFLNNSMIEYAVVGYEEFSHRLLINIKFTEQGRQIFADFTLKNIGKRLAMIVNKKVIAAPRIVQAITEGNVQLTGGFTAQEANDIAVALREKEVLPLVFER